MLEVCLVPRYEEGARLYFVYLIEPLSQVVVCLVIGYIEHEEHSVETLVETGREALEPFLASRIPDHYAHEIIINFELEGHLVHAYC